MAPSSGCWKTDPREPSYIQNSVNSSLELSSFYTTWNNSPNEGKTAKLLLSKLQEEKAITELDSNTNGIPVYDGVFASNKSSRPQSYPHTSHYYHQQYNRPTPYYVPNEGAHGNRGSYQGERGGFFEWARTQRIRARFQRKFLRH